MTIAILGRQPYLGLTELESLYGANKITPLGDSAALIDVNKIGIKNLGGTVKLAEPLADFPTSDWSRVAQNLNNLLPKLIKDLPEGKIKLGLSVYDAPVNQQQLFRAGLELKKICRQNGRSLRLVPNTSITLNSAQILHNQLTSDLGLELLIIKHKNGIKIARTFAVQDVDDYAKRDYARPRRDAFVGMLPPKLAQVMLNLANVDPKKRVLDPFCGTGVVLQEAALRGCSIYGTDLSELMVSYTRDNLGWLQDEYKIHFEKFFEVADATDHTWQQPINVVVCETYLGHPLTHAPAPEKLAEIMGNCNVICQKFLKNIHSQLKPGSLHCIAVPAWRVGNSFKHLKMLDDLENMGYNRVKFKCAPNWEDLIYHREGQIVARELLVLTVK